MLPSKLDNNFLESVGLADLSVDRKNAMLQHVYETLEMRVGMVLAAEMSYEQLDEFEAFIDAGDESGAPHWLEANFPNYKETVAAELEKLTAEIAEVAPAVTP